MGLFLTFVTGLFFIIGIVFNYFYNNKNISDLSVAMAFIVIINLVIFDIGPEAFENFSLGSFLCLISGLFILKLFDIFIPHHHHDHKEKNDNIIEHQEHLEHISIVTLLALVLHNIIECMALYNLSITNERSAYLMCLAVGLHNLPLGFQIGSCIKSKKVLYTGILSLSGFIGGILALLVGSLSANINSYLICFTLGMLVYLLIFELTKELWESRKNIYSLYGIIIGLIIIVINVLL